MNIVIVDDEPLARLRLRQLCGDLNAQLPNQVVADFDSGTGLLKGLMNPELRLDVLLLDVNMPGLDGLELAAYLREHAPDLAVILVTAAAEYALQAFEVDALDFVLKPVRSERLLKSLQKVVARSALKNVPIASLNTTSTPLSSSANAALANLSKKALHLTVRSDTDEVMLPLDEVLYFTSDARLTLVKTAQHTYSSRQTLNDLEAWLAQQMPLAFVRIHRNTLLATKAVARLETQTLAHGLRVEMKHTGELLTVSRRLWPPLKAQLGL